MLLIMAAAALFLFRDHEQRCEEGIMIDFGDHTGEWVSVDSYGLDGRSVIEAACAEKDYAVIFDGDIVTSVNGTASSGDRTWDLWIWMPNSGWAKAGNPGSVTLSDDVYASLTLSYAGQEPLIPCADAMGKGIFSGTNDRIVSLSAVATEILCKVGNIDSLAAVDYYSNYPDEVVARGLVKEWGFYLTPPTAEGVAGYDPDLVVGEKDNHDDLLNALRGSGIRCLSLYKADTLETVYRNIWMIGAATGRIDEANAAILEMKEQLDELLGNANTDGLKGRTAAILMGNEWYVLAIGHGTFVYDVISRAGTVNVFDDAGWIRSPEYITTKVPDIVIFIADEDLGDTDIKALITATLPAWPHPDGDPWENVPLYYVAAEYGDMFLRAGPRILLALEGLINTGPI
ncbi:MAG: ABC transporter substrate-binding protein [Methanomassiliicoccaceae archaeon]|jgi:iron complex transport system substrate-binding protein|nr:ABC transporter substrate-binding protein [Methanomassiliicoccaceae archaeon]